MSDDYIEYEACWTVYVYKCPVCGSEFENKSKGSIYCSKSCYMKNRNKNLVDPVSNCIGSKKKNIIVKRRIKPLVTPATEQGDDLYKRLSNEADQRKPKICPMTCEFYGKKDENGNLICGSVQPDHTSSGVRWILKPTRGCKFKWT